MRVTNPDSLPDLSGRVAVVTGATSGIGLETARMLAHAGAHVVLAGRSAEKGAAALRAISAGSPRGTIAFERFDMASLSEIQAGAARIASANPRIDILINNAGVMMPPRRRTTEDGFELQIGTNHLGHFALTGHLLRPLQDGEARVVMVSSNAARGGRIAFEDLQSERHYSAWGSYGQSKLANLLFMRQLQLLSDLHEWGLHAVAAHPGLTATGLVTSGMGTGFAPRVANMFNNLFAQTPTNGALPTVAAALEPDLADLSFIGPDGLGEWRGKPKLVNRPAAADDAAAAARLWEMSEKLTGVIYPIAD